MKNRAPGWKYVYIVQIALSSILILSGFHRHIYSFFRLAGIPDLAAACLTGAANLAWYELGYVVGGGLKSVKMYSTIPIAGSITGLLSAIVLAAGIRWRNAAALAHLTFSGTLALLGTGVLVWRYVRGYEDPWRLAAVLSFLIVVTVWIRYFGSASRTLKEAGAS